MRKVLTTLVVLVVVLSVLFFAADRIGAHYAEQEISERVSAKLAERGMTSSTPDVTITGFPFLTQVAAGSYDEIQLELRDLKGGTVPLPLLKVQAKDVTAELNDLMDGTGKAVAAEVNGAGTIDYASLVGLSNLKGLSLRGDGQLLHLSGVLPQIGEVRGTAAVTVQNGSVSIRVRELIAVNSAVATSLINIYKDRLGVTLRLPELPFQLKLKSVQPTEAGVVISVTATNVPLT